MGCKQELATVSKNSKRVIVRIVISQFNLVLLQRALSQTTGNFSHFATKFRSLEPFPTFTGLWPSCHDFYFVYLLAWPPTGGGGGGQIVERASWEMQWSQTLQSWERLIAIWAPTFGKMIARERCNHLKRTVLESWPLGCTDRIL